MDTAIYFEGDYTKTQEKCAKDNYLFYNMFGFNCLRYALSRLDYSGQIKGLKRLIYLYAYHEFFSPNEAEKCLCCVGEELK